MALATRPARYDRVVGADATSVLIEGLALPEDERARVAAELFASLERVTIPSIRLTRRWCGRERSEERMAGSPRVSLKESHWRLPERAGRRCARKRVRRQVRIDDEALEELLEAARWYEARERGRGVGFSNAAFAHVEALNSFRMLVRRCEV